MSLAAATAATHALDLHARIREAHARYVGAEHELALLLAAFADGRLFQDLGYVTLQAYADAVLDLPPRQVRSLVAIGRRLPDLPALSESMRAGRIGWTKARELVRVVTSDTDAAWVAHAESTTSRELEAHVAAAVTGELPPDDEPALPARRRLVIELDTAEAEVVERAFSVLRVQAGEDIDRGAALAAMARRILATADEDPPTGFAPYTILLQRCPDCRVTVGEESEVSDTLVAEAECDHDAIHLDGDHRGHVTRAVPPATRRAVFATWGRRCAVPGCRCTLWVDLHHLRPRTNGGDNSERNLLPLCTLHHRLLHEGVLALTFADGQLRAAFADGRELTRPDPRGPSCGGGRGPDRTGGVSPPRRSPATRTSDHARRR